MTHEIVLLKVIPPKTTWSRRGSNPEPSELKPDALPFVLQPLIHIVSERFLWASVRNWRENQCFLSRLTSIVEVTDESAALQKRKRTSVGAYGLTAGYLLLMPYQCK
ncbi:hypothetical protein BaRGS_00036053 [Batillaria attramentaria]|uniref:Uncharacterized protein n=1 Tax=Batillaria attramentaria TaxID=370345 RepID=A0ABD0JCI6_9CAEN